MIVWIMRLLIVVIFLLTWRQTKIMKDIRDDAREAKTKAEEAAKLADGALNITSATLRVNNPIRGDGLRERV